MRSTAVRRTALAASAAALTLLVTACGGSSDDGADDAKAKSDQSAPAGDEKTESEQAAPAGDALSAADLEKVALAQADVKNGEVTTEIPADEDVDKDKVSTDDKACLPLAFAQAAVAQGEPGAEVKRSWQGQTDTLSKGTGPDGQDMTETQVNMIRLNVASYAGDGAEKALTELKTAAEKCAGGFTASLGSDKGRIAEVTTTAAPEGGDEGLALTLGMDIGKEANAPMKVVVVRKGATIASFAAANLSSMVSGADFEVPMDVVDAQVAKLG
ncbi:lipoprotein [Streptomyces marokkonensis]|uniref:Lipoprotein n=1 Tax=Streptomyces marokkonensis TaxID=324855 RepID=A0ABP7S897_9ACTN